MAIDKDKLIAAIEAKAEHAYGGETDSSIAKHRQSLIAAYLGLNTNPSPEGRSQVVDRSVFETIQTMLPALVRIFAGSSDEVCKFTPVGPEDEEAAEQTTAYINHVVTQKNQWEQFCADWIHDALLLCNGYAWAQWDDTDQVERETYEGQTDEQLAVLSEDDNVRVLQHSQYPDDAGNKKALQEFQNAMMAYQSAAAQQGPENIPPPPEQPQPQFLHDVVLERKQDSGRIRLDVIPPEHCRIDADTPDWTLQNCDYFEYRQEKTIADLRAMGLDVPEDLSDIETIGDQPEDTARNRFAETNQFNDDGGEGVMRKVVARFVWIRTSAEENEESRMYYAIVVGRTPLHCEAVGRIHVVSLTPQPLPHRHIGMSVAETVLDIQEIQTVITRGGLDNLYLANNGRYAISDKVSLDDFLDSRPGGAVRLLDGAMPGDGHIFPLTHPFAFDQIIQSKEYFDQVRQNRSGMSRYFSGTDAGAINKTASGVAQLTNQSAQRVEHVARMMAPAFETLFTIVHELVSKHQQKADVIKLRGQWINVDPTSWSTKRDVRISVGVGAGNKETMLAALSMQVQEQMALVPAGIVKPENIHATMVEKAKLQGFSNPDKFWTDPSQQPPQEPPPDPEMIKAQADQAKTEATLNADMQKAQIDAKLKSDALQLQAVTADQQLEQDRWKAELEAQTKITIKQMELAAQRDIEEMRAQNAGQIEQFRAQHAGQMEQFKADTTDKLETKKIRLNMDPAAMAELMEPKEPDESGKELVESLRELAEILARPKSVVRGSDGKIMGLQ
jgi:hypothetical protein